jgi:capsular exopolysaccharide synthesis family protein
MDLRSYLRAIRKNWWIVLLLTLLGTGAGVLQISLSTPQYASSVTFFVNTAPYKGALLQSDQYAQDRVNSYVQLLSSERLSNSIRDETGVNLSAIQLTKQISATSQVNTVLLTAQVTDPSPSQSLILATSLSKQFIALVNVIDPEVKLQIVSGPTLLPGPISPKKIIDMALGILLGLVSGIVIAILREMVDNTIRSLDVLREVTRSPMLGQIRFDPLAKKSPVILNTELRSARAESFRQLRTNVQFLEAKVIVIASSVADEGKSTTATNLAISFVESGKRVLLIEADLRRPRISDYLGLERDAGLSNVLAGQVDVDDVLQPWGKSGLVVLSSGSIPPNPSELLGGRSMTVLLQEMRARFDLVIVDTPPLLPVTDGALAAAQADGAVIVVRSGKTKKHHVAAALESLRAVEANVLGCVLTMVPKNGRSGDRSYDGYGYYEDAKNALSKESIVERNSNLPCGTSSTSVAGRPPLTDADVS